MPVISHSTPENVKAEARILITKLAKAIASGAVKEYVLDLAPGPGKSEIYFLRAIVPLAEKRGSKSEHTPET